MNMPAPGSFDALSPGLVLQAAEAAFGIVPDGTIAPYSSYVNRVYGFGAEDGSRYVAKFYRPGRWTDEAIREEHRFLFDCVEADLPVAAPLVNNEGESLVTVESKIANSGGEPENEESAAFRFALFPKRGGRNFDAEADSDWLRLGALAGRLHATGRLRKAPHRAVLGPELSRSNLDSIVPLVHPEFRSEFSELCEATLERAERLVAGLKSCRIHGDLHRGNILERPGEGLLLLDFDDMMTGPPIQDLWLLLPGRVHECGRELALLEEGYSDFGDLEPASVAAIEALRFYRMLHFLAWRSIQRDDQWFKRDYPDWGGRSFWITELEDLRAQADFVCGDEIG